MTEKAAQDFMHGLDEVLSQRPEGSGPWIFGNDPTILDAHAVPMISRLLDVKRQDLLTERIIAYGKEAQTTKEWEQTTHGRETNWKLEYGHVRLLNPL